MPISARLPVLLLVLAAALPARAQEKDVVLEITSFRVDDGSQSDRYMRVGIRSNLPEGSSITFKPMFEDEPIPYLWMAAYLENGGKAEIAIGPMDRQLLPGVYDTILVVDPMEQDPEQAAFWKRFAGPFERVTQHRIGTEEEERSLRAQYKAPVFEQVQAIERATAEVLAAEQELKSRAGGRFFSSGGALKRDEFIAWADRILGALNALERFYNDAPTQFYVVYYAAAYKYLFPSVWVNARYALIDYTIYPVLERERKELEKKGEAFLVPERFQPLKGGTVRPPRDGAFAVAARDLKKVRQLVGEAPALAPLTNYVPSGEDLPAGFGLYGVPADLSYLLDQNPASRPALSDADLAGLARLFEKFELPSGMAISGHFYCLSPAPPRDGEPPVDPASRVLVLVLRFPDADAARVPAMEMARTDRGRKIQATLLSREETVAFVFPGPDEASKSAASSVCDWFSSKHGFEVTVSGSGG